MNKIIKKSMLAGVTAAALMTSCVTQKYSKPEMAETRLFRGTTVTDSTNIADIPFRQLFADTVLQGLISEGLQKNYDVRTAVEKLNEEIANVKQARAAYYPTVAANIQDTKSKQSIAALGYPTEFANLIPTSTNTFEGYFNLSWEADIWGKLSSSKKAAVATFLQTDAAKRAAQTQVVSEIAKNYFSLLAYDRELAITEQTIRNREEDVKTTTALKTAAVLTGADVVQSQANLAAAKVSLPDIKRNIRETENALCILLGRAPGSIKRTALDQQQFTVMLNTGIPSQLLKNRPDVQEAELSFRNAFENTNVAKTYFYPQLTITAEGGISTINFQTLFNNSIFYNIVGGLVQPIFNGRQNKTRLEVAKARQKEAFYNFQSTLLTAGSDVSNALYAYQSAREKQAARTDQLQALQKSVDYTKALLKYSSATNYNDVLTSEQNLLSAQLSSVDDRLQELQAVVSLYHALGGGWKN